jgi:hypothetical protein
VAGEESENTGSRRPPSYWREVQGGQASRSGFSSNLRPAQQDRCGGRPTAALLVAAVVRHNGTASTKGAAGPSSHVLSTRSFRPATRRPAGGRAASLLVDRWAAVPFAVMRRSALIWVTAIVGGLTGALVVALSHRHACGVSVAPPRPLPIRSILTAPIRGSRCANRNPRVIESRRATQPCAEGVAVRMARPGCRVR